MKKGNTKKNDSDSMKRFYFETKIFTFIVWGLFSIIFVPFSLYSIFIRDILHAILYVFMEAFAAFASLLMLHYYGNIVTGIQFLDEMTIIETNIKTYQLPSEHFYEVVDSDSFGRIYIKYADDKLKKTFVFQKQYSLFRKYSLDINLMRKNMPHAVFLKS